MKKFRAEVVAETGRDPAGKVELRWLFDEGLKGLHGNMAILAVDFGELPDSFSDLGGATLCLASEATGLQTIAECAEENARHWREGLRKSNAKFSEMRDSYFTINQELRDKVAELEKLRPHWAQGHTSDGVAAQVTTSALSAIWQLLGAEHQTEAMGKLRTILAEHADLKFRMEGLEK